MRRFAFFIAIACLETASVRAQSGLRTEHVVLVTVDGLRHQELFTGVDPALLSGERKSGIDDLESLRKEFWRETAESRREALMPFFWGELVPTGVVLGSGAGGSDVRVTNAHRVSYPGYAEILTGRAQPAITGNDPVRIPRETVLEFVRRKLVIDRVAVAAFTSWDQFPLIVEHRQGSIFVNGGARPVPDAFATDAMRRLNALQARLLSPWDSVRHNAFTEAFAFAYLEEYRPRFLYLAFDETDEWAHSRRYDLTVQAIHHFDETLRLLWERLQSMEGYRDETTLLITTDHGRGRTPDDWTSHGGDIEGAEEIWLAAFGPDTPARGLVRADEPMFQNQIAATIVRLFGLDPDEFNPDAGEPLEIIFR